MSQDPLVSVILPVYNGETSVGQTLQSALSQTYRNIEVLVVDDGSSDRTRIIVEEYAARDPRVRIIDQPNGGVARARNNGIAQARGEFIATLDADDLWDPAKIERQVRRMLEAGEGTGLVYCWWVWIDVNGTVLDRSPAWMIEGRAFEMLLRVNYTGNASVPMYRRACLDRVEAYDEDLVRNGAGGCEDWDLALRVAERYDVAVVPELLVGYRRRPGSMSTRAETMWRSQQIVTDGVRRRRPDIEPAAFEWSANQFALYLAGTAFWSGDFRGAVKWALRAGTSRLLPLIFPSLIRMLSRRLAPGWSRTRQTMVPGRSIETVRIPGPLIPYDRIYKRWGRRNRPTDT
jgi:Glycosyl transferase family 2